MTDWNLGQRGDISEDRARARDRPRRHPGQPAVSDRRQDADLARSEDAGRLPARRARERHPDLLTRDRVAGQVRLPLHTNPAAAILLVEAVEIAHNLGTNNILLPILGDSHIDMTNQAQVDTFVAMMKEVARYAEKYGVVVGLEDWISAEDNMQAARRDRF